ncbi:MAG: hypothetical protein HN521_01940 [Candidatus Latescibacteria bacterium]|jgi:hypothetical protein|nr:hypothetical protein [Candidatus Latescibacterota bacterium]
MAGVVYADEGLRFGVFYGISNNNLRWMDIADAREKLGQQGRAEDSHVY